MRHLPFLIVVAMTSPAAAVAQQHPVAAKAPTGADTDKKVCRREAPTGSNFMKRTCHTMADWQVIDAQNGANAERAIANRAGMNAPPQ